MQRRQGYRDGGGASCKERGERNGECGEEEKEKGVNVNLTTETKLNIFKELEDQIKLKNNNWTK